ncbi:MAG: hypothetical protein R3C05_28350 [Pirellulaceae bacterium]
MLSIVSGRTKSIDQQPGDSPQSVGCVFVSLPKPSDVLYQSVNGEQPLASPALMQG